MTITDVSRFLQDTVGKAVIVSLDQIPWPGICRETFDPIHGCHPFASRPFILLNTPKKNISPRCLFCICHLHLTDLTYLDRPFHRKRKTFRARKAPGTIFWRTSAVGYPAMFDLRDPLTERFAYSPCTHTRRIWNHPRSLILIWLFPFLPCSIHYSRQRKLFENARANINSISGGCRWRGHLLSVRGWVQCRGVKEGVKVSKFQ